MIGIVLLICFFRNGIPDIEGTVIFVIKVVIKVPRLFIYLPKCIVGHLLIAFLTEAEKRQKTGRQHQQQGGDFGKGFHTGKNFDEAKLQIIF